MRFIHISLVGETNGRCRRQLTNIASHCIHMKLLFSNWIVVEEDIISSSYHTDSIYIHTHAHCIKHLTFRIQYA